MPKYDVGDIIFCEFVHQNFMVVERFTAISSKSFIPRYNLLSLDTGQSTIYFTQDIDSNSRLVA